MPSAHKKKPELFISADVLPEVAWPIETNSIGGHEDDYDD